MQAYCRMNGVSHTCRSTPTHNAVISCFLHCVIPGAVLVQPLCITCSTAVCTQCDRLQRTRLGPWQREQWSDQASPYWAGLAAKSRHPLFPEGRGTQIFNRVALSFQLYLFETLLFNLIQRPPGSVVGWVLWAFGVLAVKKRHSTVPLTVPASVGGLSV